MQAVMQRREGAHQMEVDLSCRGDGREERDAQYAADDGGRRPLDSEAVEEEDHVRWAAVEVGRGLLLTWIILRMVFSIC